MYLFCIPHAGGTIVSYNAWKGYLDKNTKLISLELPGHMLRLQEELITDYQTIINDLCSKVRESVMFNEEPYAVYGHSLGSVLIYYLYHEIIREGIRPPCHLFVSGRWAPNIRKAADDYPLEDLSEFKKYIIDMNGINSTVINNKTLFDYLIKIIYSDFLLLKQIPLLHKINKFDANLTFLRGSGDANNPIEDGDEWRKYTTYHYDQYEVAGDHFFPIKNMQETVKIINTELEQYLFGSGEEYDIQ